MCFTQTQGCDEGCAHAAGTEHGCMPQLHAPSAHCAQSHRTHRRQQTHHCGLHLRDGERERWRERGARYTGRQRKMEDYDRATAEQRVIFKHQLCHSAKLRKSELCYHRREQLYHAFTSQSKTDLEFVVCVDQATCFAFSCLGALPSKSQRMWSLDPVSLILQHTWREG